MKKLITILTIMIVLVGAAFADTPSTGNAQLIVTATINPQEPTFKLSTDQANVEDAVGGNAGATKHVITADALIDSAQTVTFTITQTKMSRSVKAYTFTATATDLVLVRYKDANGNTINNVAPTLHPASAAETKFAVTGGNDGVANVSTFAAGSLTSSQASVSGANTASYVITYTGVKVANGTVVGSFTCEWAKNEDAVPGDYEATVTLSVATN